MTEGSAAPSGELVRVDRAGWSVGGRTILEAIELTIEPGECVVVVGPNGAGKSTLLRLVSGLFAPTGGAIRWRGRSLSELSRLEIAKRMAYVPQIRPSRIPLTVRQVVLLGRYPYMSRLQMAPGRDDYEAADEALRQVGLEELAERQVDVLSGGERQAVFIAAALAQAAELLVLDEPTTHLDPSHQRDVTRLVEGFGREPDRTVLVATHDLNFASAIADRVVALRAGRVLACAPPEEAMRPELLEQLFGAPFEVVRGGRRPVTVLELSE